MASLEWDSDPSTWPSSIGATPSTVAVSPLADDKTVLGGAIACSFASSDPSVVSVSNPGGRVAQLAALAPGDATVTVSCMGAETSASVHVPGLGAALDAAADDGPDVPDDAAADGTSGDGSVDANDAGANDATSDAPSPEGGD